MAEWLQSSAGLLALLALTVSAAGLIFLLLIFARQKHAARRTDKKLEGVSRRLEDAGRAMVDRAEFSASTEAQSARLLQAMEERSRDEAQRMAGRMPHGGSGGSQAFQQRLVGFEVGGRPSRGGRVIEAHAGVVAAAQRLVGTDHGVH